MKVLLIRLYEPKTINQKMTFMAPIGLYSIRATIRRRNPGAVVHICDQQIGDSVKGFLDQADPYTLIGISCQFCIQHAEYLKVADLCRAWYPKVRIVSGGFHASAADKPEGVDQVLFGSGEKHFDSSIGSIEDLPMPVFNIYEVEKYWAQYRPHDLQSATDRWMPIETSRGCNGVCSFCGVNRFWGCWEGHSSSWMFDYLSFLKGIGIQELFIEDDNVGQDPVRFEKLLTLFCHFNFKWSTPNGIKIRTLQEMDDPEFLPKSGCWRVSLPFETGSYETAKKMRLGGKWANYEESYDLVLKLRELGIKTCGFFIIGFPGETWKDMEQTIMFANALPLDQRNIYIATPYPGTELYKICKEKGFLTHDGQLLYDNLLYTQGLIETPEFTAVNVEQLKYRDRERARRRKNLTN